ncbi:putative (di)nucleoside polyphosphate hydrolase [Litoreibacter meonggei]|uniref:RNA pyrophosphohydrolase n=1 Tax=Litoreibacter meonggei TaxID=1049199 RepID=A0A497VR61_9RHOB|nr:RNA pyrophosphohydrolase [Litoreibacter meonggei]RLJ41444.1 putative (di)nucleoside polyphosphate hydrolase [Litoreibacter meonggei]
MTPEEISKLPYRPCVGVMLVNDSGLVFAAQRIDSDVAAWQMPQGGIDKGESPEVAALRELEEETGVPAQLVTVEGQTEDWVPYDLPLDLVPKIWKGRFRGQEQKWFLLRFHGTDADINIETEIPEFSEWRWVDTETLLGNIVPFKRDVYAKVIEAFRPLL